MSDANLSEIPGKNVRKAICETIEKKIDSKKFKLTVSSASKEGENNFCGVVYRVSFSATDESENISRSSMIVKVSPQNEMRRALFQSRKLFLQEIFMYNKVGGLQYYLMKISDNLIRIKMFIEY